MVTVSRLTILTYFVYRIMSLWIHVLAIIVKMSLLGCVTSQCLVVMKCMGNCVLNIKVMEKKHI